jgi:ribonuclease HI
MAAVEIFSDGACKGNPGVGGWGALLRMNGAEKELFGGEPNTTNNRMELTAVIQALTALTRPCEVLIHTDSQYVMKGMMEWIEGWKAKGWKLVAMHDVDWRWVKGHSGHPENERADQLANRGVELILKSGAKV